MKKKSQLEMHLRIESSVHDRFLAIKENISNTDEILNEKDYI